MYKTNRVLFISITIFTILIFGSVTYVLLSIDKNNRLDWINDNIIEIISSISSFIVIFIMVYQITKNNEIHNLTMMPSFKFTYDKNSDFADIVVINTSNNISFDTNITIDKNSLDDFDFLKENAKKYVEKYKYAIETDFEPISIQSVVDSFDDGIGEIRRKYRNFNQFNKNFRCDSFPQHLNVYPGDIKTIYINEIGTLHELGKIYIKTNKLTLKISVEFKISLSSKTNFKQIYFLDLI